MCPSCERAEADAYKRYYERMIAEGKAIPTPSLDEWENK